MLNNEDYLNIFHEIKNSITLISGSLQLVTKKHPEVKDFDYWQEAMQEVDFLKNMVLQLSSVRLCNSMNPASTDLKNFISQIVQASESLFRSSFSLDVFAEKNLPDIEMDAALMRQAIINLIKNAFEATCKADFHPDDISDTVKADFPPIRLEITSREEYIRIAVIDHGGGIEPAIMDNLFRPFITTKNGGSGLGLSIARQIVESHQGTLTCESRPGDGCTFTISLPVKQK